MLKPEIIIEPLNREHNRCAFDCGEEALNQYIAKYAMQDVKRRLTNCFVLTESTHKIIGFYTLSAFSIPLVDLPAEIANKLKYKTIPAALLGRLAVDTNYHGMGYGKILLADAVKRIMRNDVAICTLLVDAKDDKAVEYYRQYGFKSLPVEKRKMFLLI